MRRNAAASRLLVLTCALGFALPFQLRAGGADSPITPTVARANKSELELAGGNATECDGVACEELMSAALLGSPQPVLQAVASCSRIIRRNQEWHKAASIEKHLRSSAPPHSSLIQIETYSQSLISQENEAVLGDVKFFNRPAHYQFMQWPGEHSNPDPEAHADPNVAKLRAQQEARRRVIQPMFDEIAAANGGVVVATTVNWGQLHLLANFGKSCEKRAIDWKKKLFVYSMDSKAQSWLEREGVASYHFAGAELVQAAKVFGDMTFGQAVFFKNAVMDDGLSYGHDILYQDVDVVWNEDPTSFFTDEKRKAIDVFFSYDGGNRFWQPMFANSGFHFNRNNERTRKFWREILLNSYRTNAQQAEVEPLLVHHFFLNNLKVHILSDQFANGHLFTPKWSSVPRGWKTAHASWTNNKDDKTLKFMRLGEWHLPEKCTSMEECELS